MLVAVPFVGRALSPYVRLDGTVTQVDTENFALDAIKKVLPKELRLSGHPPE